MRTRLSPEFEGSAAGERADAILRKCVHCGFCNATCPTYRLLGDELDGPRGRIYLIKQALEGAPVTRSTQLHLDRCLTCLNCETTCPSGVRYGHLLDIGRRIVDERVPRPLAERMLRWLLRAGLTSRGFAPAVALGRRLSPLLPRALQGYVPPRTRDAAAARRDHDAARPGGAAAPRVAARRLRTARAVAEHRRGDGARARGRRHRRRPRTERGLLRRAAQTPVRPRGRARGHAPQYRRRGGPRSRRARWMRSSSMRRAAA